MHTSDDPSMMPKWEQDPWSMQRLYTRLHEWQCTIPMSEQGMRISSSSESTACVWMRASGAKRLFSELRASTRTRTGTREWKLSAAGACGAQATGALGELPQFPAMHHWDSTLRIALVHTRPAHPLGDTPRPCSRRSGPPTQRHIVSNAERTCTAAAADPSTSVPAA